MKYLVIFVLITNICAKDLRSDIVNRIENLKKECTVQENNIINNSYPWVTFIPLKTRTYNPGVHVQCIGALISKRYVITTSTCLQFVVSNVYFGQGGKVEDMLEVAVERWITYDKADIALFKLTEEVKYSDSIRPICLPFKEFKKSKSNTMFDVTGITMLSDTGTKTISQKVMRSTLTKCQNRSKYFKCFRSTGRHSPCNGDEGSPVAYLENEKWVLYGMLYTVFDADGSPCVRNSPAVGLKITDDVTNWIVENMDE